MCTASCSTPCTRRGATGSRRRAGAPGSPATGGGWHYRYWIYKPAPVIVGGFALPLSNQVMNVYAEGYFGKADAGINGFTVSAIEAEVLVPLPPGNLPTFDGDFGIIH